MRVPFVTRAKIRESWLRKAKLRARVRECLFPCATYDVLKASDNRYQVLDKALFFRDSQLYKKIRDRLRSVYQELEAEDYKAAEKLCDEIERIGRSKVQTFERLMVTPKVDVPVFKLGFQTTGDAGTPVHLLPSLWSSEYYFLRLLVAGFDFRSYHRELERVFPEFRGSFGGSAS